MSDPQTSQADAAVHLDALLDAAPRALVLIDSTGIIKWVSQAAERLIDLDRDELVGDNMMRFVVDEDVDLLVESLAYLLERRGHFRAMEFRYHRGDGTIGVLEAVSANRLDDPAIQGIVVQVHDVTPRRIFDQALESIAAGAPFDQVLRLIALQVEEQIGDCRVVVGVDPIGDSFQLAASTADLVTEADTEADAQANAQANTQADREPVTPWGRAIRQRWPVVDGTMESLPEWLAAESRAQSFGACWAFPTIPGPDGPASGCLIIWRTVPGAPSPGERVGIERAGKLLALAIERRRTEGMLLHAARHDTLTGLPNRAQFFNRLQRELERHEYLVAVLYLDLDGFKAVNDRYGHRAGDQVLITVAARIEDALRPDDLTARLGGDEFGVICARLHDRDEATAIAERLIASLGRPISLPADSIRSPELTALAGAPLLPTPVDDEAVEVVVQVSIGIGFGPDAATDHERLVELADAAMYQAKRAGRGAWSVSAPEPPASSTF